MTSGTGPSRTVAVLRADARVGRLVAERLRGTGARVRDIPGDAADGSVRRIGLQAALASTGRLDAVVVPPPPKLAPALDAVDAELRTAFFGVQDAAHIMTGGRVVLAAAARGDDDEMVAPATMFEGAFIALVRLLAVELAPRGIALNALCPIGSGADGDTIAAALAFLASDEASYMSGACLPVAATRMRRRSDPDDRRSPARASEQG
jgi:NAD(P)-dependent dehydrogenase (short-subunit alcohol dehydrogenase family)